MTDEDRKLLTEACGECWHDVKSSMYFCFPERCLSCGKLITSLSRRTFATADDWELVREKVVVPTAGEFCSFLWSYWALNTSSKSFIIWFLTLSIEERCELAVDFIKENPELFKKWIEEMERNGEKL